MTRPFSNAPGQGFAADLARAKATIAEQAAELARLRPLAAEQAHQRQADSLAVGVRAGVQGEMWA